MPTEPDPSPRPCLKRQSEAPPALRPTPKKTKRPPPRPQKSQPEAFQFLSLPPELRLMVYELALVIPNGISFPNTANITFCQEGEAVSWYKRKRDAFNTGPATVALLATCKLIESEALPVFYGQPLHFVSASRARFFLSHLRQTTLALLRDVTLNDWISDRCDIVQSRGNSIFIDTLCHAVKIRRLCLNGRPILPEFLEGAGGRGILLFGARPRRPRGQLLAEGLHKEWSRFLQAVASERGIDAVLRILDLGDECFYENMIPAYSNHGLWMDRYFFRIAHRWALGGLRAQRGIFEKEMRRLLHQDGEAEPLASQITPQVT